MNLSDINLEEFLHKEEAFLEQLHKEREEMFAKSFEIEKGEKNGVKIPPVNFKKKS